MGKMTKAPVNERQKNIARANKSGPLNKKASMPVYFIVLILAVAARTLQLYTNMNFSTGRYIDPSITKNYTMMVLIPGFALLAFILLAGSARDKVIGSCILINPMRLRYDRLNKKIPSAAGYSSLLMALLVLAEIIFDFVDIVRANKIYAATLPPAEAEYYNMLTGYTFGQGFIHAIMFFVILTFISIAVNVFQGEGLSHANCAALSLYSFWKVIELIEMLSENTAVGTYSEFVYEMFSYMTAAIFFMNTARFFNGMEKKFTRFWMCFLGYVSSILAAVSVIPRYILVLIPDGFDTRVDMNIPHVSDIGIVFMSITVVAVFWSTYVYRVMPKLNLGNRRWSRAPISKKYQEMESIDE